MAASDFAGAVGPDGWSAQAEQRQDGQNYDDHADDVKNAVHGGKRLLRIVAG
jgi:hypothetical protein